MYQCMYAVSMQGVGPNGEEAALLRPLYSRLPPAEEDEAGQGPREGELEGRCRVSVASREGV